MAFSKREGVDYISNFYRYALYEEGTYLLTLDDGSFIFLNTSALKQLKKGKIEDEQIFAKLHSKGVIVTGDNFNSIVEKTRQRYGFLLNGTSLHIVIPTIRCNQSCPYCFASPSSIAAPKDENDMDEQTAKKTVEFIMQSPSHAITIEFTGGEPLARFDLVKIMTLHARKLNENLKKNLLITIVSNLSMASEKMLTWLIDNDVTICTSLDGPKKVHDKNRVILGANDKHIGTYEKVVGWIRWINKKYEEKRLPNKVGALMTTTRFSFPYYKEIIDEYVSLGINLVDIRGLMLVGNALEEDSAGLVYPKEDFIDFYLKSIAYIDQLQKEGIKIEDRMRELYDKKIFENIPTYHVDYESPWGAATGALTYHSDGGIYACHESLGREVFKLGDVREDTWSMLFKRPEVSYIILNSMLENNVICDRCVFKPYCGTSPIENYSEFGKFNFYPSKTSRHHETIFHSRRVFDKVLDSVKRAS